MKTIKLLVLSCIIFSMASLKASLPHYNPHAQESQIPHLTEAQALENLKQVNQKLSSLINQLQTNIISSSSTNKQNLQNSLIELNSIVKEIENSMISLQAFEAQLIPGQLTSEQLILMEK